MKMDQERLLFLPDRMDKLEQRVKRLEDGNPLWWLPWLAWAATICLVADMVNKRIEALEAKAGIVEGKE
jgi:hypothetical protein